MILYIPFTLEDYFLGVTHFVFMTQHIAQGDPHIFDFCGMTNGMHFFHMVKICYLSKLGGTFGKSTDCISHTRLIMRYWKTLFGNILLLTTGLNAFLISFTWVSCFISLFLFGLLLSFFASLFSFPSWLGTSESCRYYPELTCSHSSSECGAADRSERYHWNCRHMELE